MPLKWTIDRAQRLVTVIADGEVTLEQGEEYLDTIVVADTMPYAKLLDYTRRYINLSTANRPVQICKTVAESKAWLAQQKA
jgi:hypothetical protein